MVSQAEQKRLDAFDALMEDVGELLDVIVACRGRSDWLAAWNYLDELVQKGAKARVTLAPLTMDGART
jgi:hypothetical protein